MPKVKINGSEPFNISESGRRELLDFVKRHRRMEAEHAAMAEYLERNCIVFRKKAGGPLWWDEHQTLVRDGAR
jgi:hypothetical protein